MANHIQLAKKVAQSVTNALDDHALVFDYVLLHKLTNAQDGWLDIIDLLPMIPDTNDEAIVAYAVRQYCVDLLEISEDGGSIRRKHPIPDYRQIDSRTIYVERLAHTSNEACIRSVFQSFGEIEQVVMSKSIVSKGFPGCAFVVFAKADSTSLAIDQYDEFWKPLTSKTDVALFLKNEAISPSGLRVMSKFEWNRRTLEYANLLAERQKLLAQVKISKTGQHHHATFVSGVVCLFEGIHVDTNAKYLKNMFEMVAHVAFVDFKPGQDKGYIRFKTAYDALAAETYFSKQAILQSHKSCTGILCSSSDSPTSTYEMRVKLRILQGKEEKSYWKFIHHTRRSAGVVDIAKDSRVERIVSSHVKFDENVDSCLKIVDSNSENQVETVKNNCTSQSEANLLGKHTKFDVSDDDCDIMTADQSSVFECIPKPESDMGGQRIKRLASFELDHEQDNSTGALQSTGSGKRPRRRRRHGKRIHQGDSIAPADSS
ncbi:hypothetical protein BDV3_000441 [Batrachochytrium dendrobatidis]